MTAVTFRALSREFLRAYEGVEDFLKELKRVKSGKHFRQIRLRIPPPDPGGFLPFQGPESAWSVGEILRVYDALRTEV